MEASTIGVEMPEKRDSDRRFERRLTTNARVVGRLAEPCDCEFGSQGRNLCSESDQPLYPAADSGWSAPRPDLPMPGWVIRTARSSATIIVVNYDQQLRIGGQ